MRYENLKKNDVLFCESKGSRVLKLVDKVDGSWLGRDIFTNENFELTNTDQFKLVNRERKVKPLSLLKLIESKNGPSTLTEKEVFIVDYIMDNYNPDELKELKDSYDDGEHMSTKIPYFNSLLRYLNLPGGYSDASFFQYVLCAYENIGKTITSSTPIQRFKEYRFNWTEEREQTEYNTYYIEFYAANEEDAKKISKHLQDDFWSYSPDSYDTDYGDSEFIRMLDAETKLEDDRPFVID